MVMGSPKVKAGKGTSNKIPVGKLLTTCRSVKTKVKSAWKPSFDASFKQNIVSSKNFFNRSSQVVSYTNMWVNYFHNSNKFPLSMHTIKKYDGRTDS